MTVYPSLSAGFSFVIIYSGVFGPSVIGFYSTFYYSAIFYVEKIFGNDKLFFTHIKVMPHLDNQRLSRTSGPLITDFAKEQQFHKTLLDFINIKLNAKRVYNEKDLKLLKLKLTHINWFELELQKKNTHLDTQQLQKIKFTNKSQQLQAKTKIETIKNLVKDMEDVFKNIQSVLSNTKIINTKFVLGHKTDYKEICKKYNNEYKFHYAEIHKQQDDLYDELQKKINQGSAKIKPVVMSSSYDPKIRYLQTKILGVKVITQDKEQFISYSCFKHRENNWLFKSVVERTLNECMPKQPDNSVLTFLLGATDHMEHTVQGAINNYYWQQEQQSQDKYADELDDDKNGIWFKVLVQEKGKQYIEDKTFEADYCPKLVFPIKNTDDKCCVAALICAFVSQNHFINIDGSKSYFTNDISFKVNGELQQYKILSDKKIKAGAYNLFTLTKIFYNIMFQEDEIYDATTAISRFEKLKNVNVVVMDWLHPDLVAPKEKDLILLLKDNHYNVVRNYEGFMRKLNPSTIHNKTYCFIHGCWFDHQNKHQCPQCFPHDKKQKGVPFNQQLGDRIEFRDAQIKRGCQNFISWDTEAMFEKCSVSRKGEIIELKQHVGWCLCASYFVWNGKKYEELQQIGDKAVINEFLGRSCLDDFLEYILSPEIQEKKFKIAFAHNGGKYDSYLLLDAIKSSEQYNIKVCKNAGRFLSVKIENKITHFQIDIRDSIALIPIPLKKFMKELGLGKEGEKELQEYDLMCEEFLEMYLATGKTWTIKELSEQGYLNAAKYNISEEEWQDYLQKHGDEDYVGRYIKYCHQDVKVLAMGLIKFNEEFINEFSVDEGWKEELMTADQKISQGVKHLTKKQQDKMPEGISVLNYMTICSYIQNVFLAKCGVKFQTSFQDLQENEGLREYQLGQLMQDKNNLQLINELFNTNFKEMNYQQSQKWFDDYREGNPLDPQSAKCVRHYCIDHLVEFDDEPWLVEVDGQWTHGLLLNDGKERARQKPNAIQYLEKNLKRHNEKALYLQQHYKEKGYAGIIHITDKQIEEWMKEHNLKVDIKDYFKNIHPSDSFHGGRTECFVHHIRLNDKQRLAAFDSTSHYPNEMLKNLPIGKSEILYGKKRKDAVDALIKYAQTISPSLNAQDQLELIQNRIDTKEIHFFKCSVLPPSNLNIPCLNIGLCDKLLAPVCRTCAELKCKDPNFNNECNHTVNERLLYGYFAYSELIQALIQGYQIHDVNQVIVYHKTTYNSPEYKGDNFIKQLFYKKTQNSDPDEYNDDIIKCIESRIPEIKFTHQKGSALFIQFENNSPEPIIKNAAKKYIFKLCLNSLYGKFGMKPVRTQTYFDPSVIAGLNIGSCDNNIHITKCKNIYVISVVEAKELQLVQRSQSNHMIAGLITANGRCTLYQMMMYIQNELNGLVLYCDTDSVYAVIDKMNPIDNIPFKMMLGIKNEIDFKDAHEFVCIAAKMKAYRSDTQEKSTSKGITAIKDKIELQDGSKIGLFNVFKQIILEQAASLGCSDRTGPAAFGKMKTQFIAKQPNNFVKMGKQDGNDDNKFKVFRDDTLTKKIEYNERKRAINTIKDGLIVSEPFGWKQKELAPILNQVEYPVEDEFELPDVAIIDIEDIETEGPSTSEYDNW